MLLELNSKAWESNQGQSIRHLCCYGIKIFNVFCLFYYFLKLSSSNEVTSEFRAKKRRKKILLFCICDSGESTLLLLLLLQRTVLIFRNISYLLFAKRKQNQLLLFYSLGETAFPSWIATGENWEVPTCMQEANEL